MTFQHCIGYIFTHVSLHTWERNEMMAGCMSVCLFLADWLADWLDGWQADWLAVCLCIEKGCVLQTNTSILINTFNVELYNANQDHYLLF